MHLYISLCIYINAVYEYLLETASCGCQVCQNLVPSLFSPFFQSLCSFMYHTIVFIYHPLHLYITLLYLLSCYVLHITLCIYISHCWIYISHYIFIYYTIYHTIYLYIVLLDLYIKLVYVFISRYVLYIMLCNRACPLVNTLGLFALRLINIPSCIHNKPCSTLYHGNLWCHTTIAM